MGTVPRRWTSEAHGRFWPSTKSARPQRSEATIQTLQAQRRQLAEVYTTTLQPALKQERTRYRETHPRVLSRGRHQTQERGGDTRHMDLPILDAALRAQERQREQERAR